MLLSKVRSVLSLLVASQAKIWLYSCVALYTAMFAYGTYMGFAKPILNWDMVPYVGSALSWSEDDINVVHQETLLQVKEVVWKDYYREISENNNLSSKVDAFEQVLPFYTIKPLYVGLIWVLGKLGISTHAEATWYISAFSFGLMGILLALWRPRNVNYGLWLLSVVFLVFVGRWSIDALARMSVPDGLYTLLFLAMLYSMLRRRDVRLFALFGLLSILARPDAIILLLGACLTFWAARDSRSHIPGRYALAIAGAGLLIYFAIQIAFDGYGWTTSFYTAFVYRSPYPQDMEYTLTLSKYWTALDRGLQKMTTDVRLLPMLALSCVAIFCHYMYPVARRIWPWMLAFAWLTYVVRFGLYPAWWAYRHYYIHYLIALMACVEMIPPYLWLLWRGVQRQREELRKELRSTGRPY